MTDPDQDLEVLLAALNSADPPAGMNQRILNTIADTLAEPAVPSTRRAWALVLRAAALLPRTAALLTVAATAILVFSLNLASRHRRIPPAPASTRLLHPDRSSLTSSTPVPQPSSSPWLSSAPAQRYPGKAPHTHAQVPAQSTRLASFPAPPMPLTTQEKLLLRVARANDTQQSPILNPGLRASLAARDSEDFQVFFAPATTIHNDESPN